METGKRVLSLFIALLLVTSLLTACGNNDDTSEPFSDGVSSDTDASEGNASEELSGSPVTDESEEISGEEKNMKEVSISVGKTYTTSLPASNNYPDTYGTELTDGMLAPRDGATYTEKRCVGYETGSSSQFTVTVDLGQIESGITRFGVDYLSVREAGVAPPKSVNVKYSDDGKKWSKPMACVLPEYIDRTMQEAVCVPEEEISCRYVRFTFMGGHVWLFLDEVNVYAKREVADEKAELLKKITEKYMSETLTAEDRTALLDKISTGSPDRTKEKISIKATYKTSVKAADDYPDVSAKLTDGALGTRFEDGTWVGYEAENGLEVVLTLDKKHTDVAAFSLHTCAVSGVGAKYPDSVTVFVSNDSENWTEAGRTYTTRAECETYGYELVLPCTVEAKYVKFILSPSDDGIFLVDEASAYYYGDVDDDPSVYPALEFPKVEENVFWDKNESDYSVKTDLIRGLGQQISCINGFTVDDKEKNSPITFGALTDGRTAPDMDIHDGSYFKFYAGGGRAIFYDVGKVSTFDSFDMSFVYRPSWSVYVPGEVDVLLSLDAVTWYKVGSMAPEGKSDPQKVESHLDIAPAAARFVCFRFKANSWVGIDEIKANGTKEVLASTKSVSDAGYETNHPLGGGSSTGWANASPDLLEGAKDVYLAYHGKNLAWNADDFYYEIAYTDKDGKALDTMFDGILFLMGTEFPSGLGGGTGGVLNYNKSDAEWLVSSLFASDQNISALEISAGKLKKELSLPDDYKVKFYLSLYHPSCSDFGDIDGDGKSETTATNEGRAKILCWLVDKFEESLAKQNYENIVFGGYYWYNESIRDNESATVSLTAEHIHAYGRQFFWIPYFSASGIADWRAYGFDTACLQPNFAFSLDTPTSRVAGASSIADLLGMSIEIEMDGKVVSDERYRLRYYEYLKQGAKLGFMEDAMHLYYMGVKPYSLAKSLSPAIRQIYDYTYGFIKGTLELTPEKLDDVSVTTGVNTMISGSLISDGLPHIFKLIDPPSHGTVTLNDDGTFDYYPDKGYNGSDVFTFRYSDMLDYSDIVSVNVTVG